MFARTAAEKGTAFRRCLRKDLDVIFSVQTERAVAKDNTVTIRDRYWQLEKTPFRGSLAGCTVTVCEHLDGTVSIRWGPHTLGWFDAEGKPIAKTNKKRRGKGGSMEAGGNQKPGSHRLPHSLGNLAHDARFPLSHRADYGLCSKTKPKTKAADAA